MRSSRRSANRRARLGLAAVLLASTVLLGMGCPGGLQLRVGICQRDITPISPSLVDEYEAAFGVPGVVNHTEPVFMAGFGDNRRATGYNDRLWARGVVVEGLGDRIAIVALDLVGYFNNEVETIRGLVDPLSNVDYVVVHSTHQHEGPDTLGIWGPDATQGRIVDPRLSVMQFTRKGPPYETIATLVNFASHPESMGSNNTRITSDFPHYARERIEDAEGGMAIWVSGDLGVLQGPLDIDVLDPVTNAPATRRTFRWAEVHGTQLADRALTSLSSHPGNPLALVAAKSTRPVAVPLANPYFRFFIAIGVLNERSSLFTDGVVDDTVGNPFPPPFTPIPQALGEDLHTEVGVFRINEGSFAVVPSELDPQIGETYRAAMTGAHHTFLIGLGNDEIGYQVPFAKWDNSCHACAPFVLAGVPQLCPLFPNIDCNTVFQNNVGQQVDPSITNALMPLLDELHF